MRTTREDWSILVADLFREERAQFGAHAPLAASLYETLRRDAPRRAGTVGAEEQVKGLGRFLFGERRYRWRLRERSIDFTLTGTLLNNGGNCLGLTTLYCSLAASWQLPVAPLLFEGHIVPCFCDGERLRLIDHVRKGAFLG